MNNSFSGTLRIVWLLVELAAAVRCGVSSWNVVYAVSNDLAFTAFTVITIEGVFVASLFLVGDDAVAPIAALLALLFSGLMQWLEVLTLTGALSDGDRVLIRVVVSFAPIAILAIGYIRKVSGSLSHDNKLPETKTGRGLFDVFKGRVHELRQGDVSRVGDTSGAMVAKNSDTDVLQLPSRVRKCSECGKEFTSKRNDALTCSAKCRRARGRRLA